MSHWVSFAIVAVMLGAACRSSPPPKPGAAATSDSAFASLQDRGEKVMVVDQYNATHVFEDLRDGGRIVLEQNNAKDTAGINRIRAHMREIAIAFAAGRFDSPFLVHAQVVPGTDVMRERRKRITYGAVDRPRGAEVRIVTWDTTAVGAVHAFLAFQRGEHRAAGHETHSGNEGGGGQ